MLELQRTHRTKGYLNGTVCECIIEMCNPRAAGELCVMERAGLHHSLHGRLEESRVREADRDGARGGGVEERHHTDSMNDTSYDCLGQSCSLWVPILHSPTVLHFTSPVALIYYTQQNCYRLDSVLLPISFQTFSLGDIPGIFIFFATLYSFVFVLLMVMDNQPRASLWSFKYQRWSCLLIIPSTPSPCNVHGSYLMLLILWLNFCMCLPLDRSIEKNKTNADGKLILVSCTIELSITLNSLWAVVSSVSFSAAAQQAKGPE